MSHKKAKPFCAGIMIINGNDVLMLKRSKEETSSKGKWECPGGHIKKGETAWEAAKRETEEEIGRKINNKPIAVISTWIDPEHTKKYVMYIVRVNKKFKPKLSHEHSDGKWFSINDLPENMIDKLKENMPKYKKAIMKEKTKFSEWIMLRECLYQ